MKITIQNLFLFLCFSLSVNVMAQDNSPQDRIKVSLDGLYSIYDGYFSTIKIHHQDLDKALEEGDKYIQESTKTIQIFGQNVTNIDEEVYKKTANEVGEKIKVLIVGSVTELGKLIGDEKTVLDKILPQAQKIGEIYNKASKSE